MPTDDIMMKVAAVQVFFLQAIDTDLKVILTLLGFFFCLWCYRWYKS